MNRKMKTLIFIVLVVLAGMSLYPLFVDPFHSKETKVCFWEWAAKEIWGLINGEVYHDPQYP